VTSPDTRAANEPGDPRMLLPEWLRDPAAAADADELPTVAPPTERGQSTSSAPDQPEGFDQSGQDQGIPQRDRGLADSLAASAWQQPPPTRSGTYDPSTFIGFDDLPPWVQRLQGGAVGPATETVIPTAAQHEPPVEQSMPLSTAAFREPDVASSASAGRLAAAQPESDLSLERFFWVAGTAIVLIVAALIVLFG